MTSIIWNNEYLKTGYQLCLGEMFSKISDATYLTFITLLGSSVLKKCTFYEVVHKDTLLNKLYTSIA